jgi:hypothetical protein
MSININVKHTFKVNGKEYSSTDEMPPEVREIFQKAMAAKTGSGQQMSAAVTRTKIFFNGTEYASIDKMPQDVRQLYEKVLKAAETGAAPSDLDLADMRRGILGQSKSVKAFVSGGVLSPPKTEPAFSARTVIVGVVLAALIFLIYYLAQHR